MSDSVRLNKTMYSQRLKRRDTELARQRSCHERNGRGTDLSEARNPTYNGLMGELWSCSAARLTNGSAQDLARQYLRTVTYADWEEGAQKHAHKRDSHGVADQGRNKPDGKLETGVIVRKVRQPMRHLRDTK